ncbi:MAG: glutathione synthase [Pseudomonadota bacterium]
MKICFIMYPWERITAETDTTLRLIHECAVRGHTLAITTANNLTIRENTSLAFCNVFKPNIRILKNAEMFHRYAEFKKSLLPLAGFDAIFLRTNPPVDTLALNFLDSIKDDVFIMNDLDGIRIANNKLYTNSFSDADRKFLPETHVSKNKEYLERIFNESSSDRMILKPLNGFGGRGVILIEKSARHNFRSLLDFYIGDDSQSNYVILQEYADGASEGDVRILMLNGEPIGAMKRVPDPHDIRSNVHAGGHVVKHTITREERLLCQHIGPKLVRDGLYFVGIDVINGKLIEVNVLSPGGIVRINRLNRCQLQKRVIDFIENIVSCRENTLNRKHTLRKIIEDEAV